jgi:ubiquitin
MDSQREQEAIKLKNQLLQSEVTIKEKVQTDEAIRLYQTKKQIDEQYAQLEHARALDLERAKAGLGVIAEASKTALATGK